MSLAWQRAWEIFEDVVSRPESERGAFLERSCDGDPTLRKTVDGLLAASEVEVFFDRPVIERPRSGESAPVANESGLPDGSKSLGPYRLLRPIGQGGMSTVYLATRADDAFQRRVAIKLVRRGMESDAVLGRLRAERQILAALDHPNIARLYDGGTTADGLPYFVMEHVDGVPIDRHCDQQELSIDQRVSLFRKVCAAVAYAHQNLVIHRDLKPSNILVTVNDEPKLLDFGIAKLLNPELAAPELEPTATWQRMLTPSYASPEQLRGGAITTASDVFSLGVLLYKLLAGQLPFDRAGTSPGVLERRAVEDEPTPPSAVAGPPEPPDETTEENSSAVPTPEQRARRRALRGDLDAIVLKTLRPLPRQRYGSVEQLDADLERYQRGLPVEARQGSWRYRAGRFVRRNRTGVTIAAALALLLFGFAAAMAWQAGRIAAERDQARLERDQKESMLDLMLDLFAGADPYQGGSADSSVREVLGQTVPVLEERLREQPAERAQILHAAGSVLARLGAYRDGRDLLEQALTLRRELYGDAHREVAETMSILGGTLREMGELERAEKLTRAAVTTLRPLVDDRRELVRPLAELVQVLCHREDYDAAEPFAREVLALARTRPDHDLGTKIVAIELMARVHGARGEHPQAARLYRESLALRRVADGEEHPEQLNTLTNLGAALRRQGELEAAERVYREALELGRKVLGDRHPKLAATYNNLAGVRFALGDLEGSEDGYRLALEIFRESVSPDHWRAFFIELRLARVRLERAPAEVEGELRVALDRWRDRLGEHWILADAEGILGQSISVQGRCAEARPLLERSFEQLLVQGSGSVRGDALERLREHFERCGEPGSVAPYEARLAALAP